MDGTEAGSRNERCPKCDSLYKHLAWPPCSTERHPWHGSVGAAPAEGHAKGYKHRDGSPVSDACGDGKHEECNEDYSTCGCTYRGPHKNKFHRYMSLPVVEAATTSAPAPRFCPECHGTGRKTENEQCSYCLGTGGEEAAPATEPSAANRIESGIAIHKASTESRGAGRDDQSIISTAPALSVAPAGLSEREAFTAWFNSDAARCWKYTGGIDNESVAWAAWQARAQGGGIKHDPNLAYCPCNSCLDPETRSIAEVQRDGAVERADRAEAELRTVTDKWQAESEIRQAAEKRIVELEQEVAQLTDELTKLYKDAAGHVGTINTAGAIIKTLREELRTVREGLTQDADFLLNAVKDETKDFGMRCLAVIGYATGMKLRHTVAAGEKGADDDRTVRH